MPLKRNYYPRAKRQRQNYEQSPTREPYTSSSTASTSKSHCDDSRDERSSFLAPSSLLYDPQKRLTFPPDQQPPPSNVLQRFTQAFNLANNNSHLRQRRPRSSAMNSVSTSKPSKRGFSGTEQQGSLSDVILYDDDESLLAYMKDEEENENVFVSKELALRSTTEQYALTHIKQPLKRQSRQEDGNYDQFTTISTPSERRQRSSSMNSQTDWNKRNTSISMEPRTPQTRNLMNVFEGSLPAFLSDITVPTNDSFAEQELSSSRQDFTRLDLRPLSISSSPASRSRASTIEPRSTLKDNIWSRQEQKLTPMPTLNQFFYSNPDTSFDPMAMVSTRQRGYAETHHQEEEEDHLPLPSFDREEDDSSSNEFVYNRQSSPDWISASREDKSTRAYKSHQAHTTASGSNLSRWMLSDDGEEQARRRPNRAHSDVSL